MEYHLHKVTIIELDEIKLKIFKNTALKNIMQISKVTTDILI